MKRAALLLLAACGRVGFAPELTSDAAVADATVARPELVQVRTADDANVNASTVNLAPTRAGGLIVIATLSHNIGSTSEVVAGITDDAQNSYVFAGARASWNGDDGVVEIWYAPNARPGASIVRIASTGLTTRVAWALELMNMEPTAPLVAVGQLDDQASTGSTPAAPVVGAPGGAVVVSLVMVNGTVTQVAAGNPFSLLPVINGDAAAYAIVDAPGSYGAVLEAPGSGNYGAVTAAFRGLAPE